MKLYSALEVAQLEWFTNAGKPAAAAYPYRVIYVTDRFQVQVSDGTNWNVVADMGLNRWGGTSSGTDTVTLTPTPALDAYRTGQAFAFIAGGTNTGAATLNISALGAIAIKAQGGEALTAGQITSGRVYLVRYDGTNFICMTVLADAAVNRAKLATGAIAPTSQTATKTTTYAVTTSDDTIPLDATGGAFTTTLPTAVGATGRRYKFIRVDETLGNAAVVGTTSSQTINGVTTFNLRTQYEMVEVESNGANWLITNRFIPATDISWTPGYTAFGTSPTTNYSRAWRTGKFLNIEVAVTTGTAPAASETRLSLPTGLTTPSGLATLSHCGEFIRGLSATNHGGIVLKESSVSYVTFSTAQVFGGGTVNALAKANGADVWDATTVFTIRATVPISGWEG